MNPLVLDRLKTSQSNKENKNKKNKLIQLDKSIYKGAIYMGDQLIRRYMRNIANEMEEFLEKLK
jgi:hypothetical protein